MVNGWRLSALTRAAFFFSYSLTACVAGAQSQSNKTEITEKNMPATAPLFLESDTYSSKLYLVNPLTFGVQVNVTLFDMSGEQLAVKSLYLTPNSQQSVAVKQILSDAGMNASAGSVQVMSPQTPAPMLGQLSITRTGDKLAYLDEELFMPSETASQTLRSVIDSPENSPIVAITNTSTVETQGVQVDCTTSSGSKASKTLTLEPKQTILTRACSATAPNSSSGMEIDGGFDLTPENLNGMSGQGVAGITITGSGSPGELAAFGFVEHKDVFGSYFSAMNFYDPKTMFSPNLVFTGVPVGASHLLPTASYAPQLAVANFTPSAQTVTVSFASTSSGFSVSKSVASVSIPANSSLMVPLAGLTGDADWQNSFLVHTSGKPGDVLAKMMFKSASLLPNIELIGKDADHVTNAGDHPWSTENGMSSSLVLYNYSPAAREVTVRIASGADIWLKIFSLQPNETKTLSINAIILGKVPDSDKHVLSSKSVNGEVGWWAPSPGAPQVTGRVIQIDAQGAMARNFSCPSINGICDLALGLSEAYFQVNDPSGLGGSPDYCEYSGPPTGCPNDHMSTPTKATLNWSWASGDTSIAQITAGSSTANSTWTGMSIGRTTSSVTAHVQSNYNNYCSAGGGVNITPPCPTTATLNGTIGASLPSKTYANSRTGIGILSNILVSPSTTDYTGVSIQEQVTPTGNTCPNNIAQATSFPSTTSSFKVGNPGGFEGQNYPSISNAFYDQHVFYSDTDVLSLTSVASCSSTATQVYTCNGQTIGTFSLNASFSRGTVAGQSVTNITVSKQ